MGATSQALLDFSREFDVSLMDNVVTTLYSGSGGKEVSDLIFHLVSSLCLIACTVCLLPLATIGTASPDAIPRSSRGLDTSPRHHGTIVVSSNKSAHHIRLSANRGCATDIQLTSVHRFADPRETGQHAMENTSGGTTSGCV